MSADVRIPAGDDLAMDGDLSIPADAYGVVLFAHGTGSSRFSPRNRTVAAYLNQRRLGTLLLDLLVPAEEEIDARTAEPRFDIPLLGRRLVSAVDWLASEPRTYRLPIAVFGASTGAAGALYAATLRADRVRAIVSRGGRADLAARWLADVRAPTLLIVGQRDPQVLELNRQAEHGLASATHELAVVPEATHLFEEPGALDRVAELAGDWFERHLTEFARSTGAPVPR